MKTNPTLPTLLLCSSLTFASAIAVPYDQMAIERKASDILDWVANLQDEVEDLSIRNEKELDKRLDQLLALTRPKQKIRHSFWKNTTLTKVNDNRTKSLDGSEISHVAGYDAFFPLSKVRAGFMLGYTHTDTSVPFSGTVNEELPDAGSAVTGTDYTDRDSFVASIFGSYPFADQWSVDAYTGYGMSLVNTESLTQRLNGATVQRDPVKGETNSNSYFVGSKLSYMNIIKKKWFMSYSLGAQYFHSQTNPYHRSNGTDVGRSTSDNISTTLSVRATYQGFDYWKPYGSISGSYDAYVKNRNDTDSAGRKRYEGKLESGVNVLTKSQKWAYSFNMSYARRPKIERVSGTLLFRYMF